MRINKSEQSKKIGQLKGIVPSRTTIEALKGVLCSDGYLIASDTNLTVKAKLEGMEEETEPFIIPAKAFDFIGSLPDGELEFCRSGRTPDCLGLHRLRGRVSDYRSESSYGECKEDGLRG